jgi:hypothetical protein
MHKRSYEGEPSRCSPLLSGLVTGQDRRTFASDSERPSKSCYMARQGEPPSGVTESMWELFILCSTEVFECSLDLSLSLFATTRFC